MDALPCPKCGRPVDLATRRCAFDGTVLDSETIVAVATTIDSDSRDALPPEGDAPEEDRNIGVQVDKYVIEGVVGRGGMGTVYRARHADLGHEFAIKVLDARLMAVSEVGARFLQEAKAAARIGHPNIVQVFDFAKHPKLGSYIVMELLRGESLDALLARERKLDVARALNITLQICDAVGAAHALGIVHRDIKPANIFLVPGANGETAKVMDFGVAKHSESKSAISTRPGAIVGTPLYMSPEQWESGPVDVRSDIYSLGLVLYQLVTGELPYKGSMMKLATSISAPTRRAPREIVPDIDPALDRAILKAIAREPADRFATIAEMVAALRSAREGRSDAPSRKHGRRRRVPLSTAVLLAAGAAAAALVVARATHHPAHVVLPAPAVPSNPASAPQPPTETVAAAAPAPSPAGSVLAARKDAGVAAASPAADVPVVRKSRPSGAKAPSIVATPKAPPSASVPKPTNLLFSE